MQNFIEVTDEYQNKKVLIPINRICFIRERVDGCAIINFEMSAVDRRCTAFIEKISDIVTVEDYNVVVEKIKKIELYAISHKALKNRHFD